MTIQGQAEALAQARKDADLQRIIVDEAQIALEATDAYKFLEESRNILSENNGHALTIKAELSVAMIAEAEETGERNFVSGKVVTSKQTVIFDEEAALDWALERKIALQLNKAALKKVADTLNPDGVRIEESLATRVSTDLSHLLKEDAQ